MFSKSPAVGHVPHSGISVSLFLRSHSHRDPLGRAPLSKLITQYLAIKASADRSYHIQTTLFATPASLLPAITTVMPSVLLVLLSVLGVYLVHIILEFRKSARSVG
jgi:hypothetical protein